MVKERLIPAGTPRYPEETGLVTVVLVPIENEHRFPHSARRHKGVLTDNGRHPFSGPGADKLDDPAGKVGEKGIHTLVHGYHLLFHGERSDRPGKGNGHRGKRGP